jgi:hypothetical protein
VTGAPLAEVASTVMSDGTVRVGFVVSCTVTVNDVPAPFPAASDALQFTVVVVMEKVDPEPGEQVTVRLPLTESVAVGFVNVTVAPEAEVASVVMFPGTLLNVGGVVSRTVIVKLPEELLLDASVAVQLTVVAPSG